jgi:hypothetical protein
MRQDFPLEHRTAFMDTFNGFRSQFYFFVVAGNPYYIFNGKTSAFNY